MKLNSLRGARLLILLAAIFICGNASAKQKRVLVFSKTAGFRHTAAIAAGKINIPLLGAKHNFDVDTTENADVFTTENLKKYAAVVFLCTTGNILNDEQQKAFEQYIKAGGGFVGVHSAADKEYEWPWYAELNW